MAARPIVFLDTETTALGHQARPWEIAVIHRRSQQGPIAHPGTVVTEDTWVLQVEYDFPSLPAGTTAKALDVGRWLTRGAPGATYLDEVNADGVNVMTGDEADIARKLADLLHDEPILAGVGVHFDAAVLSAMFNRHDLPEQPWHYALLDLKSASWGFLRGREMTIELSEAIRFAGGLPVRSEAIAQALCVDPPADDERHTALGDARWARRWFDVLAGGAS